MITLCTEIVIQVSDGAEALHLDPKKWYNVIGTLNREYVKAEKREWQDLLIIVNDEGHPQNVFMSKCKIRRADKKGLSGFDATDFLKEPDRK